MSRQFNKKHTERMIKALTYGFEGYPADGFPPDWPHGSTDVWRIDGVGVATINQLYRLGYIKMAQCYCDDEQLRIPYLITAAGKKFLADNQ